MCHDRRDIRHGTQSLWNRPQIDVRWCESIHIRFDLSVCSRCCPLHRHTDELPQQGAWRILTVHVGLGIVHITSECRSDDFIYSVSPIYYVTFTTAVLLASFVLFQGFNITDGIKSITLLTGFLVIFLGVYLLNYHANPPSDLEFSDHRLSSMSSMSFEGSTSHSRSFFELHDSTRSSMESQSGDRDKLI
jgi:hypothetical protein